MKCQKILEQSVAVLGKDGFGMELHPFDFEPPVAEAHDDPPFGPRRDNQRLARKVFR